MNFEPGESPETFAIRYLEHQGAVVEKDPHGWEVLLPEALSGLLDAPEYLRVDQDASPSDTENGYALSFGSPLLEKMVDMACAQVPVAGCELSFDYLKSQGFDRLIREHIRFPKAVGQVESAAKAKTTYLLIHCRYLAQSDEQKEGLITLWFNYDTGALVSGENLDLAGMERHYLDSFPFTWDPGRMNRIIAEIKAQTSAMLEAEIRPFRESMGRRFKRDVANLKEYYGALKEEMEKGLKRPGLSQEVVDERREKIGLLPDELTRKKEDLFKKYSITIKVQPCAAMFIRMPTVRVLYRVTAGKQKTSLPLTYNPLTRSIEPVVCQGCGRSMSTIYWCHNSHLLCYECRHNCPVCG